MDQTRSLGRDAKLAHAIKVPGVASLRASPGFCFGLVCPAGAAAATASASRPAPSASWPPQTPSIASALKARYLMVLTVPSDLSRARHRPGLHSEMAAIRPSHRARSSTTGPGESRQVFVPLELSSELCPSPNLRPTSDRRPRSVLKATADHSTHNLAHLGPSSPFAFTVNIRMGHWGRGTNVAKPNA